MIRRTSNPIVEPVDPFDLDVLCQVGNVDVIQLRPGAPQSGTQRRLQVIKRAVGQVFGVSVKDLESARRGQWIAQPRLAAYYVARHTTGFSYPQIARAFGARDHTTVLKGIERATARIACDAKYQSAVEKVMEMVQ